MRSKLITLKVLDTRFSKTVLKTYFCFEFKLPMFNDDIKFLCSGANERTRRLSGVSTGPMGKKRLIIMKR